MAASMVGMTIRELARNDEISSSFREAAKRFLSLILSRREATIRRTWFITLACRVVRDALRSAMLLTMRMN